MSSTLWHPDACSLFLEMRVLVSRGTVGRFRQSYDTKATLSLTGKLAEAIRDAGLRPGEKSRGIKREDLDKLM
jgi:hypothetical protein